MRVRLAVGLSLACLCAAAGGAGAQAPVVDQAQVFAGQAAALRAQLRKERGVHRVERLVWRRQLRAAMTAPDMRITMRVAGVVYGVNPDHLLRCALSEGGRLAEARATWNTRPNTAGSGATGLFQFMPGTWRGTPFGGLPIGSQTAQVFGAAWMWSRGRIGEWAGAGC